MTVALRRQTGADQSFVLSDMSWGFYERLLKEIGDRHILVTYDDGELEIMSPSQTHEQAKRMIGRLIEAMTVELRIPMMSCGSTTFKRRDLKKGLEPDECYYIQHESEVRGKTVDLRQDPPPDLAIEVDIYSHSIAREPVYVGLGVPELWRYDGRRLVSLHLTDAGKYRESATSLAFPWLQPNELVQFLRLSMSLDETSIILRFRKWLSRNAPKQ